MELVKLMMVTLSTEFSEMEVGERIKRLKPTDKLNTGVCHIYSPEFVETCDSETRSVL